MSLSIETVCKTCKKVAPWLSDGEGGFIGKPSVSTTPESPISGPQNFGYIYRVLERVGIVTHDWHAFHDFLAAHRDHELVTLSDGEGADELGEFEEPEDEQDWDEVPEGWDYAILEARCHECRKRYRTENGAYMRVRGDVVVEPEAVAELKRVLPSLPDNLYRCEPLEDLGALAGFFERHNGHEVTTRIVSEEE